MITVIHGGQTGTDRGAHEAAIDNGWLVGGFMPRDVRDEDGPIPPDVAHFLWRHDKTSYAARTEANVHGCDALLVVVRDAEDPRASPGTAKTIDLATDRHLRRMIVDPTWSSLVIARWIWHDLLCTASQQLLPFETRALDPVPVRLMVAGPRESKWSGARVETAGLLRRVGDQLRKISVKTVLPPSSEAPAMNIFRAGLYPIFLRAPGNVSRALTVACPICRERPGQACKAEDGVPVVHDARESVAYHQGNKISA